MLVVLELLSKCISHGSVSVFQVGVSFSVYRSVFFQVCSVFVIGFSKFHDIGSVFLVFHFADPKILLRVSPRILTEDPCPRSRRWQNVNNIRSLKRCHFQ